MPHAARLSKEQQVTPETGREVIEEPLSARRLEQLVAARRWL